MVHALRPCVWQVGWQRLREWFSVRGRLPRRLRRVVPGSPCVVEQLEDRCLLTAPQILLTPSVLANLRQDAALNTPGWQAFQARLNSNLDVVIADDIGSYEGEQLDYIIDYALGYQVLQNSDPATADNYADKAIGLMKSGLDDYQRGSWVARQFLARGDGVTRTFSLPNADLVPSTLTVYLSAVATVPVVHQVASGQDTVGDDDLILLKASNTRDGPADYAEGADWTHNPNFANNLIDWSAAAKQPKVGGTYFVTYTSGQNAQATTGYTLSGNTITFAQAPGRGQAVLAQYIYGTHANDGSTLAFQQTSSGNGGFNSIFIDDNYTYRHLGTSMAIGLDWLDGYVGLTPALEQRVQTILVQWSDYVPANGYLANSGSSNYGDSDYESEVMTALALGPRDSTDGPRLLTAALAWRQDNVLPVLENPTTSDAGGFWAEGWNYGTGAVQSVLIAADALQTAGLITATPEAQWCNQLMDSLAEEESAPGLTYDGGEDYQYPFHFISKSLFYVLSQMCASPTEQSYANFVIQNYPDSAFGESTPADYRQLLFDDPAAPASFWSALPLADFASGTGLVTARSDWGSTPTWVAAQIGNMLPNTDHQFDPGQVEINRGADQLLINAFQVYYVYGNDGLAPDQFSSLGNLLVINDHGAFERFPPNMGATFGTPGVVDTAYENTAGYTYFDGDYHAAYSTDDDPGGGGPTSQLTRQVVFVRPDLVFVYDRATTLSVSYNKILRWHFQNAPAVKGNSFTETVGSSRLFGQMYSTVPLTTSLSHFTEGNAPFAIQQLDTQNIAPTASVRYVTAFQVAPSSTTTMAPSTHIVSTNASMEGAQIGSQVVLFGRDGPVAPGATVTYAFNGSSAAQHMLVDLLPSQAYEVIIGGSISLVSTSDQGTLTFSTPAGVSSVTVIADRLALTSPLSTTFIVGENNTFTLTAQGFPTPALTATGPLPSGVTFTDNSNGTATLAGTPAFGTSGTYSLTITLHNGVVPDGSETFTLDNVFANLLVTAPAQVQAGESFSATALVVDINGDPLTSFTGMVGLAVSGPAPGTLMGVTRVPVANGVATFPKLALSGAGNYTLRADSDSDLVGSTVAVSAQAVTTVTHFRISGAPVNVAAGQSFNITITALDALNRVVTDFAGTIQLATNDPQIGPVDYTFSTTDNGALVAPVLLDTAGSRTITVSDTARPTARGASGAIKVTAGTTVAGFTVAGFPLTDVIGAPHPVIVTAVDPFGNRVSSYRGQVQLGVTGGAGSVPPPYTFTTADGGAHPFTITLAALGSHQTLTAVDTGNSSLNGSEPGIGVVSPATHLAVTLTPVASNVAGSAFTITVSALDLANRPDGLFTDQLHFVCSDPQALPPPDQPFSGSGGRETFTIMLKTAGAEAISVTDVTRPTVKGTSNSTPVVAGSVLGLTVTGFPSPTLVDAVHRFVVTAVDSFNNRVAGYRGQVQLGVIGGSENLPGPYTFTAADQGRHTFGGDFDTVGSWSLTASDMANGSIAGAEANINVASLTAGIVGPADGVPGQPLSFTLSAIEDGAAPNAVFQYRIDWIGNGTALQVVTGVNGMTVTHVYPSRGNFTPTVTVVDSAGNVSRPATAAQQVSIVTLTMETDPANSGVTDLAIGGTAGNDVILITPADALGQILSVSVNGVVQPNGPFAPTRHILVYGNGGNDQIRLVAGTNAGQPVPVAVPALLFAGNGNCTLSAAGSSAGNVLVGGAGKDSLTGGAGRDILIGGGGADILQAGSGGDVLIGGSTTLAADVTALAALLAEWDSADSYLTRVQTLFGMAGGLNHATVINDAQINQLVGGTGQDWFWLQAMERIGGTAPGEIVTMD
jgi:hypothetical protein